MKHKFTIELTDTQLQNVKEILPKDASIEEILPMLIELGAVEFLNFAGMRKAGSFMDHVKTAMSKLFGEDKVAEPVSKRFGVMRPTSDGGFEPVPDDELPAEIREHLIEMEAKIDEGVRNGRSMVEVMAELGGTVYNPSEHHPFHPEPAKPATDIVSEGNLVHFPTTTKRH